MSWNNRNLQKKILETLNAKYPKILTKPELECEIEMTDLHHILPPNLSYLEEHGLIELQVHRAIGKDPFDYYKVKSTAKGIDFIENDGGLSAILDVVTIKLHSETIQQLLTAKISEADIPEEEKNKLKEALKTVQNSALETLTEKAIETIPAMQFIGFLKAVVGL